MYRLDGTGLYRVSGTKDRPLEQAGRLSESKTLPHKAIPLTRALTFDIRLTRPRNEESPRCPGPSFTVSTGGFSIAGAGFEPATFGL